MLLCERFLLMAGLEDDATCAEVSAAADGTLSGDSMDTISSLRSRGKGGGISILAKPREALRSRKLWPLARLGFSAGTGDGPEGKGMPGPSGGGRSLRPTRVAYSSSSDPGALTDSFDLFRGVEVLGGNAKFMDFAVCISSRLPSAPIALLCGIRSREGDGDGEFEGGLGVLRRPGTCNRGGRKNSGSEVAASSSKRPRREDGNLADGRGRTVLGDDTESSKGGS